jgi:2-desacetyl-2-hydroxyethyl bacteriochlorophyllide A dehydrogenase
LEQVSSPQVKFIMRKLLFSGPRQLEFTDHPDEPLAPLSIRLRSLFSGISHGTEMNFYRGTAPHFTHRIDGGLFQKLEREKSPYPIWHGYETVGEVVEAGREVTDFKVGDIVWAGTPHADVQTCDTTLEGRPFFCERAPAGADPKSGIFLALAGVALDGCLTSALRLGETGLISGLGCIGLLCVQLAARAGVHPIIAVDPLPLRRQLAREFGADVVLDPLAGPLAEQVREINGGRGVDAAIETSGNWRALHQAIRCCASHYGRVVALGFYQGPGTDLRLGEEFHHSSFYPMGASSILAINHRGEPAPGRAWDRIRVYHTLAQMLGDGRLKTDGLLTHLIPYAQAAEAFALVDEHPEQVIKVALGFEA